MKHVKKIIVGTLIVATTALGASAYANRDSGKFQDRMIERISKKLELSDTQKEALMTFGAELVETRELMRGGSTDIRSEMSALVTADTFDQGKALSMINDRAAALQNNAPELVAAAAVFFDGLDASQKEQITKFAEKRSRGHRH
ncbi:MAG: Spy/CpxP family protein refolding chaperone [Granulosicoccus sp.]